MGLNFSHGFAVIYLFTASRAFVEFKRRHSVSLSLVLANPAPSDLFYLVAATGRTLCDTHHSARLALEGPFRRNQKVIGF